MWHERCNHPNCLFELADAVEIDGVTFYLYVGKTPSFSEQVPAVSYFTVEEVTDPEVGDLIYRTYYNNPYHPQAGTGWANIPCEVVALGQGDRSDDESLKNTMITVFENWVNEVYKNYWEEEEQNAECP